MHKVLRIYSYERNIRELAIPPPQRVSETTCLLSEAESIPLHIGGFIDKKLKTFTSIKNFINILYHDTLHLFRTKQKTKSVESPKSEPEKKNSHQIYREIQKPDSFHPEFDLSYRH